MKLKNKKTGVIGEVGYISTSTGDILVSNIHDQEERYHYKSLAELNAEWEDYEEPKEYWYINASGDVSSICEDEENPEDTKVCKEIGNYFSSREEAEKAVEKLKAWKRLEDKGFRFCGHDDRDRGQLGDIVIYAEMPEKWFCCDAVQEDLDDCFGGEK